MREVGSGDLELEWKLKNIISQSLPFWDLGFLSMKFRNNRNYNYENLPVIIVSHLFKFRPC